MTNFGLIALASASLAQPQIAGQTLQYGQRVPMQFAQCMLGAQSSSVMPWLDTLLGTKANMKAVSLFQAASERCNAAAGGGNWRYGLSFFDVSNALIEVFIAGRLGQLPTSPPTGLNHVAWYGPQVELDHPPVNQEVAANALGFCVAKTDWSNTRQLFQSPVGSESEAQAIARLRRSLPGCVTPGATLAVDKSRLRSILNEAVYHALKASRDEAAVGK